MSGGVRTALEEALAAQTEEGEPVQADLLDGLEPERVGALDAPSPLSLAVSPRGPGRRPGSRNKRTDAVSAWLLSQGRHPVLVMMEAYQLTPAQLADRIGLQPGDGGLYDNELLLDLYKLQMRMAETAAPYVAQKLPQAVTLETPGGDFALSFVGVSLPARGGAAGENPGMVEGQRTLQLPPKSDA